MCADIDLPVYIGTHRYVKSPPQKKGGCDSSHENERERRRENEKIGMHALRVDRHIDTLQCEGGPYYDSAWTTHEEIGICEIGICTLGEERENRESGCIEEVGDNYPRQPLLI